MGANSQTGLQAPQQSTAGFANFGGNNVSLGNFNAPASFGGNSWGLSGNGGNLTATNNAGQSVSASQYKKPMDLSALSSGMSRFNMGQYQPTQFSPVPYSVPQFQSENATSVGNKDMTYNKDDAFLQKFLEWQKRMGF